MDEMYDVFIFIETWLNENFLDNEIFDPNLYQIFRKDRDCNSTGQFRGGGVLIAVKCSFSVTNYQLLINDPMLDQLCVSIKLHNSELLVCASYIPPNSVFILYKSHVDNISAIYNSATANDHICVLGDFNLAKVDWFGSINSLMSFSSAGSEIESYVLDNLLGLNLIQINKFPNKNNRILDLIFVSENVDHNIYINKESFLSHYMHHLPLALDLNFYDFEKREKLNASENLNFKLGNYELLNECLDNTDWNLVFNNNINENFHSFLVDLLRKCRKFIPCRTVTGRKISWQTKEFKHMKNLKNKFFKLFRRTGSITHRETYRFYTRKLNSLTSF